MAGPDYPQIGQRTALSSRSSLRSLADGAPSRSTVQVAALPRGAKVEIELIAEL